MKEGSRELNYVKTTEEIDFLIANRHNLKNFHYVTNDEAIYNHFCDTVAKVFEIEEDPKNASNITEKELVTLNEKYNLNLKSAYLNGPTCGCGRNINGYDFIVNAIYKHGAKFMRNPKTFGNEKFIMPFKRAMDFIVCTSCGDLSPLAAKTWYKDSSSIDTYGPCCSK